MKEDRRHDLRAGSRQTAAQWPAHRGGGILPPITAAGSRSHERTDAAAPWAQQFTNDLCGKNAYLAPALSLAALRHKRAWVGLLTSEPHVAGLLTAARSLRSR